MHALLLAYACRMCPLALLLAIGVEMLLAIPCPPACEAPMRYGEIKDVVMPTHALHFACNC